jgi:16S rRNA (cytosine967-C5)-methyltransferase
VAESATAGVEPRRLAWNAVTEVLKRRVPLDEVFEDLARDAALEPRDEALSRAIAVVTFRRYGTLRHAVELRLEKGPPKEASLLHLLMTGAAQIVFLDVPDHAAVDTCVAVARSEHRLRHAGGLVNAVLRRISRERAEILADTEIWRDTPDWLRRRWIAAYGEVAAADIAKAHLSAASIDLTVKEEAEGWAERLDAALLPTGSLRLRERTPIRDLPGFEDGAWWVQDAAAALPARLLATREGERVADLCAAPGGKTAQLAAAGADVLALDRSAARLRRVEENLARLKLPAKTLAMDAQRLEAEPFDAILLDAPCTATGTIRRHPDVPWTKSEQDLHKLTALQTRLLDKAAELLRPGGRLVYCTCSLEPEEGERQVQDFLARHVDFARRPIDPAEVGGLAEIVTAEGDLRTLPFHLRLPDRERSGMDGFYAARLVRSRERLRIR